MENPIESAIPEVSMLPSKALATPGAPLQAGKFEETPTTIALHSPALLGNTLPSSGDAKEAKLETPLASGVVSSQDNAESANPDKIDTPPPAEPTTKAQQEEEALPLHPLPKISLPSYNFELQEVSTATALEVTSLDITPHGNYILLGCTNGSIYLHDLSSSTCGVGLLVGFIKVRYIYIYIKDIKIQRQGFLVFM